ncbi:MAG: type II secretion system protein GspG [Kiritimatiellaeota bacterium]|nr:type II secretion system protein GspG [Kiritimatiellota bacterium]
MKTKIRSQMSVGRKTGFTMVELLAVITIIMILAGLVLGAAAWAGRKADLGRCQARMQIIKNALEDYKLDYGKYYQQPAAGPVPYAALFTTPLNTGRPTGEKRPYLTETNFVNSSSQLMDPWGVYFRYQAPGTHNKATYDLWSFGPNGVDDSANTTSDDLNNWASGH